MREPCERCVELEKSLAAVRAGNLALREKLTALHLATARWIDCADRWLKTGVPATSAESKEIYDQAKAAIAEAGRGKMRVELMMTPKLAEANCLAAIADPKVRRDQVAVCYADMIRYCPAGDRWGTVNRAIMARWSPSALNRIKRLAWKIVKETITLASAKGEV